MPRTYETLFELASGGMGSVTVAMREEKSFTRYFAIKRLHAHLRDDDSFVDMFMDEARIAGLIHHANVVSVIDVGTDSEGPFLVMELIQGVSAGDLLKEANVQNEPIPVQVAIQIVLQASRGLEAAHELVSSDGTPLEVVHRDVSPQNILVGFDGTARVTDFGVARALGRATKTVTGMIKGKLGYLAPEQIRLESATHLSDIYSLGVVLFELLSGRKLFPKGTDLTKRVDSPPPNLGDYRADVEDDIVQLVSRMLSTDPKDRPQKCVDVADRLQLLLTERAYNEGSVSVSEWLREIFPGAQEDFAKRIRMVSERLRRDPEPSGSDDPSNARMLVHPSGPAANQRHQGLAWMVGAVLFLACGAGAAWFLLRPNDAPPVAAAVRPIVPSATDASRPRDQTDAPATETEPQLAAVAIPTIEIEVTSTPPGATVFVGDVDYGTTPVVVSGEPGQQGLLRLEFDGYDTNSHPVMFNRSRTVNIELQRHRRGRPRPQTPPSQAPPESESPRGWYFGQD